MTANRPSECAHAPSRPSPARIRRRRRHPRSRTRSPLAAKPAPPEANRPSCAAETTAPEPELCDRCRTGCRVSPAQHADRPEPRHGRARVLPGPRPARPARPGPERQPRPRAALRGRPDDAPEDGSVGPRTGLPDGRAPPRRPGAQERRRVHHPPAGGDDHPRRVGHDAVDAVRGPPARHGRGHVVHAGSAHRGLRRGGRGAGRRGDEARQGHLRRHRAVRDHPQDGRGDEPRHPRAGHQARRPPAQHADAALSQAGDPTAQGDRDARDLRPARAPARHEHRQVGARGPRVRHPAPEDLRRDRPAGGRPGAGARRVPLDSHRRGVGRSGARRRSGPR